MRVGELRLMRGRHQRSGRIVTELAERQQERVVLSRACVMMSRARKGAKLLAQLYLDVHLGIYNNGAIAVGLFSALWSSIVDASFHERAVVAPLQRRPTHSTSGMRVRRRARGSECVANR